MLLASIKMNASFPVCFASSVRALCGSSRGRSVLYSPGISSCLFFAVGVCAWCGDVGVFRAVMCLVPLCHKEIFAPEQADAFWREAVPSGPRCASLRCSERS